MNDRDHWRTRAEEHQRDSLWAAEKLLDIKRNYGNSPFTTDDLERISNILGQQKFIELLQEEPNPCRPGDIGDY